MSSYNDDLKDHPLIKQIKSVSPEQAEAYGWIERAHKSGYVCNVTGCNNGKGEDGTGAEIKQDTVGTYYLLCPNCQQHRSDYIDGAMKHYGYSDFWKTIYAMADAAGIPYENSHTSHKRTDYTPDAFFVHKDTNQTHKSYIHVGWHGLHDFMAKFEDNKYRGISEATYKKFGCGYAPDLKNPELGAFIIPTSYDHILKRAIYTNGTDIPDHKAEELKIKKKPHYGSKEVFGLPLCYDTTKPIFVVEGEFDAMSVDQCKFNAVAISGSAISKKTQQPQFAKLPQKSKIIVMLDDDGKSDQNAAKCARTLMDLRTFDGKRCNFLVYVAKLNIDGCKDANEALQKDPDALKDRLQQICDEADIVFDKQLEQIETLIKRQESITNSQSLTTKQIIPDCPADLYVPEGFVFSQEGIFKVEKNDELTKVVSTPVVIKELIHTTDHDSTNAEIAFLDKRQKRWISTFIANRDIADTRKVITLADFGLNIAAGNAKYLTQYLFNMSDDERNLERLKQIEVYKSTGWQDEDFNLFAYPEQVTDKISNMLDKSTDFNKTFRQKGDKQAYDELLDQLLKTTPETRMAVGLALGAPLLQICKVRNPQLHFFGESGSGKSANLMIAASLYGDPSIGRLLKSFNSTGNALENLSTTFKDLPIFINDFQTAGTNVKVNFDTEIYKFEDGQTKARLNRNAEAKEVQEFHACRFTAGEQPLTSICSNQGSLNRVIEYNANHIFTIEQGKQLHRFLPDNFGFYGKLWIDYVKKHADEIKRDFYKVEDMWTKFAGQISHDHITWYALTAVCLMHFYKMREFADNVCEDMGKLIADDFKKFAENSSTSLENSNAARVLSAITELVASNSNSFIREVKPGEFVGPAHGEAFGVIKLNKSVGMFPGGLKKTIQIAGFPSPKAIISTFAEWNVFEEPRTNYSNHKHQKFCRYDNSSDNRAFMYVFKKEVFTKECGIAELLEECATN